VLTIFVKFTNILLVSLKLS